MAKPTAAELKAYARPLCDTGGLHWPTIEKQFQQESGWEHYDAQGNVKTSYSGVAKGVTQLNANFYGPELWQDPYTNAKTGIGLTAGYLKRFGTYRLALSAYNWGPGNVGGYKDSQGRIHPAWDGSRAWKCPVGAPSCATTQRDHYLDVILGPEWKEPVTEKPVEFAVGSGLLALMSQHGDSPATDEMYFKSGDPNSTAGARNMYSQAYGKSGALYVYLFSTNETFRFPPDR